MSCAGPDFSAEVQHRPDDAASDAHPDDDNFVICNCPDPSATDGDTDGATDAPGSVATGMTANDSAGLNDDARDVAEGDASEVSRGNGTNETGAPETGVDVASRGICDASAATSCGGACVDPRSDSRNCASCGHDCLGGGCNEGVCQAVVLAASNNLSQHSTIAANGEGVFWTTQSSNDSGILYASPLPAAGSVYPLPSKTLASGLNIFQIALDALNVYWGDPYGPGPSAMPALMKIPVAGGYPPAIIPSGGNAGFPVGVAVDSSSLYVANELNVLRVPLSGSTTAAIASASQAYVIASDDSNLYWTDAGASTIMMMPKSGGQPVTLATGQGVATFYGGSSLAVDSANVYWLNSDGSVRAVSKSSGATPSAKILVPSGANGIAADGTGVYWTNVGSGAVMNTTAAGGTSVTIASNQTPLGAIAVDSNTVYWTGGAGVMAIAR